ncbi:hypothetical protein [Caballeronia grimmiae]|uniref:hypothetical protein n=1 Tax=Caballeronia grimmiae TaxID=1071679 RepID=UPI0038BB4B00
MRSIEHHARFHEVLRRLYATTKRGTADLRNVERAVLACSMLRYYSAFARTGDAANRRALQHASTFALSNVPHREVFPHAALVTWCKERTLLYVENCVLHSFFYDRMARAAHCSHS